MQQIRKQLRLVIFTGIAVGMAVIFWFVQAAGRTVPADKITDTQLQSDPVPQSVAEKPFEFPDGGRELLPNYRLVALYGSPGVPVLGILGEQNTADSVKKIKDLAAQYQEFSEENIYPTFEIITTVAAANPTENGDYSSEISIDKLKPWIEEAKSAGVYIILDLQPGLTDFLSQAKLYEELLKEPHVGLALDPEWRLKPGQKHMKQIGSVSAAEINQTADWLADLVKDNKLPQKLFLIHQFKLSMISQREALDASRDELAWLIQMDGLGNQNVKQDTWRNVRANTPDGIYFGWKNFIDEDKPMLTPKQTMTKIDPKPYYISYQ